MTIKSVSLKVIAFSMVLTGALLGARYYAKNNPSDDLGPKERNAILTAGSQFSFLNGTVAPQKPDLATIYGTGVRDEDEIFAVERQGGPRGVPPMKGNDPLVYNGRSKETQENLSGGEEKISTKEIGISTKESRQIHAFYGDMRQEKVETGGASSSRPDTNFTMGDTSACGIR